MDPQTTIDIGRQAVQAVLVFSAPVLIVAAVVGIIVGVLQALTQVQDQTILFVAKLIATVAVITLCIPWFLEHMTDYSRDLIQQIPATISENSSPR